jgi:2-methylcitrate dehydratase PrpD
MPEGFLTDFAQRLCLLPDPVTQPRLADLFARHAADAVAAIRLGAETEEGRALVHADQPEGRPAALGMRTLPKAARLAALGRLTEADAIHRRAGVTPSVVAAATALLPYSRAHVGQETRRRAFLAGVEAMVRLSQAVGGAKAQARGLWPSHFAAAFGAAAAASVLLELPAEGTARALALALSAASPANPPPPARWHSFAVAVAAGLAAVTAAARGLPVRTDAVTPAWLEASFGLPCDVGAFACDPSQPALMELSLKPYPAAKQTLAATEAARDLLPRVGIASQHVQGVTVFVPPDYAAMVASPPRQGDRLSALTSAPLQIALALADEAGLYDPDRRAALAAPEVERLVAATQVAADPDLAAAFPATWPARVEVTLDDGEAMVLLRHTAPGDPEEPLDVGLLLDKWRHIAGALHVEGAVVPALEAFLTGGGDLDQLTGLLADAYT